MIRTAQCGDSYGKAAIGKNRLAADAKTLDQFGVSEGTRLFQVHQKTTTLGHQSQEASPGMVVFLVRFEVLGEFQNPAAQNGYLDLGRTRVRAMLPVVGDNLLLFFGCECHPVVTTPFVSAYSSLYFVKDSTSNDAILRNLPGSAFNANIQGRKAISVE